MTENSDTADKLILVDDENDVLVMLRLAFSAEGFEVRTASSAQEALEMHSRRAADLVITDLKMPAMDGMALLRILKKLDPNVEVIILTGYATVKTAVSALRGEGAFDFHEKPLEDLDQLISSARHAVAHKHLQHQNQVLQAEKDKLLTAIQQSPNAVVITDREGRIEFVNNGFIRITGYPAAEATGNRPGMLKSGRNPASVYHDLWQTIQSGGEWKGELLNRTRDGRLFWERMTIFPVRDARGDISHFVKVGEDITAAKETELALAESQRLTHAILNALPAQIVVLDAAGDIIHANAAWAAAEWKNACGDECAENYLDIHAGTCDITAAAAHGDPDKAPLQGLREVLAGRRGTFETEFPCTSDGETRWFLLHAVRLDTQAHQTVVSHVEITLMKQMEDHLIASEKMAAIATLAGGIAHEFNNALAGVVGYIDLLEMKADPQSNHTHYFTNLRTITRRMTELSDQLLAYARGGKFFPRKVRLNDLIFQNKPFYTALFPASARFQVDIPETLPVVKGDIGQLQMVITAILKNAAEASAKSGRIRLSLGQTELDPDQAAAWQIAPGTYVRLRVTDNGSGMTDSVRRRIFDPFYSTKFYGRGLGMAAAFGAVKSHGGHITIASEPEKGCTVEVFLPVVPSSDTADKPDS